MAQHVFEALYLPPGSVSDVFCWLWRICRCLALWAKSCCSARPSSAAILWLHRFSPYIHWVMSQVLPLVLCQSTFKAWTYADCTSLEVQPTSQTIGSQHAGKWCKWCTCSKNTRRLQICHVICSSLIFLASIRIRCANCQARQAPTVAGLQVWGTPHDSLVC